MLLEIQNLSVSYGNHTKESVKNVNLTMRKSEIVSVVGESGSGKTTLVRSILGLLPAGGSVTNGDIRFEENSLLSYTKKQWLQLRGSEISMIFQDSGAMLNPIHKIETQFISYIRDHRKISRKEAGEMAAEMLERMRLADVKNVLNSYPFQLSGGMRQRVGIAMAMTFQPKLLLADEPTSALDVTTQAQIVRQMMELREKYGTSIILVTHNIGVAAYMGDKILVMKNGAVVDSGGREHILHHSADPYTRNLMLAVPSLEGEHYD